MMLALVLAGCGSTDKNPAPPASSIAVDIVTARGAVHRFKLEAARSEAEQEKGLTFRYALPVDGGMIFLMDPPRPATFWMKNMVIPVDMIFVRPDGSIARIAADMQPYALDPEGSGEPVAAVMEIRGGRSAALGIASGDHVQWKRDAAR